MTLTRRIHVTGWQGKVSTGGPTKTPVSLRGTLTGLPSKRSGTFAISLLLALPGLPSAPSIAPTNGAHRDEEEEYRALDPKGVLGKTDDEIKHLSLEDKLQYARDFPTRVGTELTSKFSSLQVPPSFPYGSAHVPRCEKVRRLDRESAPVPGLLGPPSPRSGSTPGTRGHQSAEDRPRIREGLWTGPERDGQSPQWRE